MTTPEPLSIVRTDPFTYPERCSRVSGDHSRLGCCLARPRAEHERPGTHQTVSVVARVGWSARARITAPEAGAIPILTESFRFTFPVPAPPKIPLGHYFLPRRLGVQSDAGDLRLLDHRVRFREDGPAITLVFADTGAALVGVCVLTCGPRFVAPGVFAFEVYTTIERR